MHIAWCTAVIAAFPIDASSKLRYSDCFSLFCHKTPLIHWLYYPSNPNRTSGITFIHFCKPYNAFLQPCTLFYREPMHKIKNKNSSLLHLGTLNLSVCMSKLTALRFKFIQYNHHEILSIAII